MCVPITAGYERNMVDQPRLPQPAPCPLDAFRRSNQAQLVARPFVLLCICQHLMRQINPRSSWGSGPLACLKASPHLATSG